MDNVNERWELRHTFSFEAAHMLMHLPQGHKCGNMHGHHWNVTACLTFDKLDKKGFTLDFHDVKAMCREKIHNLMDHKIVNHLEQFDEKNTSCEELARVIFDLLQVELDDSPVVAMKIIVEETPGNSVSYTRNYQAY